MRQKENRRLTKPAVSSTNADANESTAYLPQELHADLGLVDDDGITGAD